MRSVTRTILGFIGASALSAHASALTVTVSIQEIEIDDGDFNTILFPDLIQYQPIIGTFQGRATTRAPGWDTQYGVCLFAPTPNLDPGCNRFVRNPNWVFSTEVDRAAGPITFGFSINDEVNDTSTWPLALAPADNFVGLHERGLYLVIDPATESWFVRSNPGDLKPTESSGDLGAPSLTNDLNGIVRFSVTFQCHPELGEICGCTTPGTDPVCSGRAGTIDCTGGVCTCVAPPLNVPEDLDNGMDDDCDLLVDECNADQVAAGETLACSSSLRDCAVWPGVRTCVTAEQPPGPCEPVDVPNACLPACATEIAVTNVAELRMAVQQAALTDCRDVIVLGPGTYDLFDQQLVINDSLEIRGQGTSFGCEGLDFDAFTSSSLSPDLGSARCDGDEGEDPAATVITTTRIAGQFDYQRLLAIGTDDNAPDVTLRHLTLRGGNSDSTVAGDEGVGINSRASRLQLFNVVVERNVAPAPGAAIHHQPLPLAGTFAEPGFIMVNSTVRENRSTTTTQGGGDIGLQGDGGGMRLLPGSSSFILRSSIVNNAALRGAGISAHDRLGIFNSTISGNVAGEQGAGVWFASMSLLELHHVTITNNAAHWILEGGIPDEGEGAGIAIRYGGTAQLHGSIVAGNVTCQGEQRVGCDVDADCGPDGDCDEVEHLCLVAAYPPDLEKTNICAQVRTDCLALERPGEAVGTFESWGGNVASEGCGVQPSLTLPSGVAAQDVVVELLAEPSFSCQNRTPLQTALDLFCYRGLLMPGNVGGQVSDPTQPVGDVPPQPGDPLLLAPTFVQTSLVGPLADNGGPTPTHAIPATSLAAGASQTLNDPGDIADAFPSTVPSCPVTDQRGFASAAGARPLVCDAGAFQSVETSAMTADELADELSLLFADGDGDGIADNVDLEPAVASFTFDDALVGGSTGGEIVSLGDQVLLLFDRAPNPGSGLVAIGLSEGGATPASIRACGGAVEVLVGAGEIEVIDCGPQPGACVLATERLTIHDRAVVDVQGVLGGEVSLGQARLESSVFATDDLALQRTTIQGDAVAGGDVTGATDAEIAGAVTSGAYLRRRTVAERDIAAGSAAVVVDYDATLTLAPGAYGSLLVNDRGTLVLSQGTYTFSGVTVGNDATLELSGFVRIESESSLAVGDRVAMLTPGGEPAASSLIEWYTNAATVDVGHDVVWAGTLLAPAGAVTVRDRTTVGGCLGARSLSLGFDTNVASSAGLALVPDPDELEENGCSSNADCPGGTCVSGVCVPAGGGACTEATAIDLGAPGTATSVANDGCVRVRDGYPSWWDIRQMKLETTPSGVYPVPFTWQNACGGSGSGAFGADWQAQLLPATNEACATVIDLQGSGSGSVTLRYWAQ